MCPLNKIIKLVNCTWPTLYGGVSFPNQPQEVQDLNSMPHKPLPFIPISPKFSSLTMHHTKPSHTFSIPPIYRDITSELELMQQHQTKANYKRRKMRGLKVPSVQGENQPSLPSLPPPPDNQKCPRCESFDTKFCYYNNYSITQPRYFCRDCRRYWTQGGSLRNVPHGGRSLKAKLVSRLPSSPTYLLARATHKSASKKQDDHPHQSSLIIPPQQQVHQSGGGNGGGNHDQEFDESLNQFLSINNNGGFMRGSASTCDLSLLQGLEELQIPQLLAQVHEYGEFNVGDQTNMTNTINADINDQKYYSLYDQSFNINNSSSNVVIATNGGFWSTNGITNGCDDQSSMNTSTTSYWYEALRFSNASPLYQPSTTQSFY